MSTSRRSRGVSLPLSSPLGVIRMRSSCRTLKLPLVAGHPALPVAPSRSHAQRVDLCCGCIRAQNGIRIGDHTCEKCTNFIFRNYRSARHYNRSLLPAAQRDRLDVVLVSPRNPLNIGAAARAMANFGFRRLSVVAPYAPPWREARSAIGAPELLASAAETGTLAEAVAGCTLVAGTGTVTYRKPEQPVVPLPDLGPLVERELARGGRVALVFGSEKHGLTRDDLSYCHLLVEIPTDPRQPSMNFGQAVAVCLYERAARVFPQANAAPEAEAEVEGTVGVPAV